ncbi:MAG: GNAT family N-acetyltransferase [Planctomycetes bacterium]|nr:GNAT family N-acetyltransferase [Planctomycetota bacterium]
MNARTGSTDRRALRLMERVLRGGGELAAEYPLVFGADAPGSIVTVGENGIVHSACAILVRDLVIGAERLRVGLIGSVATDPAERGRGLATEVLARAERELARDGAVIALLWADDAEFYRRRGWREFASELDFAFDADAIARLPRRGTIRRAAPDDEGALHRLYQRHRARIERTEDETRALLRVPGMETLVLHEDRDVRAYACLGRGADFEHTIHEWAGGPDDVLALVRAHFERANGAENVFLLAPTDAQELASAARTVGAREWRGVLALAKVVDPLAAAERLADLTRGEIRVDVETTTDAEHEPQISLAGPTRTVTVRPNELLELIAPARGECARLGELERALDVSFAKLPLAPFVWGLDSI